MLLDSDYYYQSWLTLSAPSMNNFAVDLIVLVVVSIFIHFCESLKKKNKKANLTAIGACQGYGLSSCSTCYKKK